MVLGRLVHYGVDALLVSTVLAGVKRNTGFSPDIDRIATEPTVKSVAEKYLGAGEIVYDSVTGLVVNSGWFKRGERR